MLGLTNSSNAPSVVLKDTTVSTWDSLPSTGTDSDMKTQGYAYYSSIPATGVTANTIAEVTFSDAQAKSGNYAPVCRTYADEIRVYSKVNTSITIPSIIIHSIVENYYEVDNSAPTSGKTTAISSGAVYDAIMTTTFNHKKTFSSMADLISFASNLNKMCYLRCSHLQEGYDYWNLGVMLAPSSSSVAWFYTASFGLYRPWNSGYGTYYLPLFVEVGTTSIAAHIFPLFTTTSSEQTSYVPVEYCELYY